MKSHYTIGSNEIINVKEITKFLPKTSKNDSKSQFLKIFVEPSSLKCLKFGKPDENTKNGIKALKVPIIAPVEFYALDPEII